MYIYDRKTNSEMTFLLTRSRRVSFYINRNQVYLSDSIKCSLKYLTPAKRISRASVPMDRHRLKRVEIETTSVPIIFADYLAQRRIKNVVRRVLLRTKRKSNRRRVLFVALSDTLNY